MPNLERIKKYENYLFLNTTPTAAGGAETWTRVTKSTDWTDTMNAATTTYDYISDSSPTDEIESYHPSTSVPYTAFIGDPIYDYVFNLYQTQATGMNAVSKTLRVYQQQDSGYNLATLADALITIDNYNIATGVITFDVGQRGTPTHGTASMLNGAPTFTPTVSVGG